MLTSRALASNIDFTAAASGMQTHTDSVWACRRAKGRVHPPKKRVARRRAKGRVHPPKNVLHAGVQRRGYIPPRNVLHAGVQRRGYIPPRNMLQAGMQRGTPHVWLNRPPARLLACPPARLPPLTSVDLNLLQVLVTCGVEGRWVCRRDGKLYDRVGRSRDVKADTVHPVVTAVAVRKRRLAAIVPCSIGQRRPAAFAGRGSSGGACRSKSRAAPAKVKAVFLDLRSVFAESMTFYRRMLRSSEF
eukprot:19370-Chlamydomonas_euryale.AAC.2